MVSLHFAQWLADEGFGTLDTDIFWEDVPLDSTGKPKNGVWVVSRAPAVSRRDVNIQNIDIYARFANKVTTHKKLDDILQHIWEIQGTDCNLPTVPPYSTIEYTNVRIYPTSGIDNVGADEQDKIVKVISAEVRYKKENNNG